MTITEQQRKRAEQAGKGKLQPKKPAKVYPKKGLGAGAKKFAGKLAKGAGSLAWRGGLVGVVPDAVGGAADYVTEAAGLTEPQQQEKFRTGLRQSGFMPEKGSAADILIPDVVETGGAQLDRFVADKLSKLQGQGGVPTLAEMSEAGQVVGGLQAQPVTTPASPPTPTGLRQPALAVGGAGVDPRIATTDPAQATLDTAGRRQGIVSEEDGRGVFLKEGAKSLSTMTPEQRQQHGADLEARQEAGIRAFEDLRGTRANIEGRRTGIFKNRKFDTKRQERFATAQTKRAGEASKSGETRRHNLTMEQQGANRLKFDVLKEAGAQAAAGDKRTAETIEMMGAIDPEERVKGLNRAAGDFVKYGAYDARNQAGRAGLLQNVMREAEDQHGVMDSLSEWFSDQTRYGGTLDLKPEMFKATGDEQADNDKFFFTSENELHIPGGQAIEVHGKMRLMLDKMIEEANQREGLRGQ